jgi:hypothetical protein
MIRDVETYVPPCFPLDRPLTIRVSRLLGLKRLIIEGWRLM